LVADVAVRLVDVSRRGCLLESSRQIAAGTEGRLRVVLGGVTLEESVRVARCQPLDTAGTLFRVGSQFVDAEREAASLGDAVDAMSREGSTRIFVEEPRGNRAATARGGRARGVTNGKGAVK
jgi:hypothetical protein